MTHLKHTTSWRRLWLGASLALLSAGTAQAAVTTLGSGLGRECYEAAERERNPELGAAVCSQALTQENMALRDVAATHVNRGILRMRMRDGDGALADFDRAARLMPAMGDAYLNRGVLLIRLGRDTDAIADLTRGLELGSTKPQIGYYSRAVAYELQNKVREAYVDYSRAAALDPEWALPREQLQRFQVINQPVTSTGTPAQQQP